MFFFLGRYYVDHEPSTLNLSDHGYKPTQIVMLCYDSIGLE